MILGLALSLEGEEEAVESELEEKAEEKEEEGIEEEMEGEAESAAEVVVAPPAQPEREVRLILSHLQTSGRVPQRFLSSWSAKMPRQCIKCK
ncbi:hypothetical protein ACFO0O_16600 [Cobetia amphilecti]|uniref:Uncharacterized protein n=1 Tax=Cobetia amphilecti TaxID=1055104 RepID=A0ABT6UQ81_9GAMM|nr:hypothetical protein [Cobetia amphilecti]MDI5884868.1 hypothetical protein [Cobetia amphilecti]